MLIVELLLIGTSWEWGDCDWGELLGYGLWVMGYGLWGYLMCLNDFGVGKFFVLE